MVSSWQQNNCADLYIYMTLVLCWIKETCVDLNIYDVSLVLDQGSLCGFFWGVKSWQNTKIKIKIGVVTPSKVFLKLNFSNFFGIFLPKSMVLGLGMPMRCC